MDLKLNRFEALIDEDNLPSVKLATKIKMTYEGVRRSYHFNKKEWEDQKTFSICRRDLRLQSLKPKIFRP